MTKYIPESAALDDVVMTGEELMESTALVVKAMSSDYATRITFAGEGAFTDGADVTLPVVPMDASVTKRAALVIAGYGSHEALHKKLTDFSRLAPLMRKAHKEDKWLTKSMANGIEDVRIEHGGTHLYGGIAQAIDKTAREVNRQFIDEVYPSNPDCVDDFGKIGPCAITWEGRRRLGYPDPSNQEALDLLPPKIRKQVEKIVDQVMDIPHGVTGLGNVDQRVAYNGSVEAWKLAKKIADGHMRKVIKTKREEWEKEHPTPPPEDTDDTPDGDSDTRYEIDEEETTPGEPQSDGPGEPGEEKDEPNQDDKGNKDGGDKDDGDTDEDTDEDADDGVDEGIDGEDEGDGEPEQGEDGSDDKGMERNDGQREQDTGEDGDDPDDSSPDVGITHQPFDPSRISQPKPVESGLQEAMKREIDDLKQQNGGRGYTVYFPQADKFRTRRWISDDNMTKRHGNSLYAESKSQVSATVGTVRRKLERVVTAMSRTHWENNKRNGRLDVRRNVSKIVNLKSNVFRNKVEEININTAITILIDMSGSMWSDGKDVMCQQITIAVAEALAPVGVPLEVLGHQSGLWLDAEDEAIHLNIEEKHREYGRYDPITLWQFKDFEDSIGACRSSLGTIHARTNGSNADGDAIIMAAKRLYERPEEKKILFVLSDGQPAYISATRCIHQYTRDAVEWCAFRGIDVMGLGILDDSVSQYYPQYVTVADLDQFGTTYIDQIVKLMLSKAKADQTLLIKTTTKRNQSI